MLAHELRRVTYCWCECCRTLWLTCWITWSAWLCVPTWTRWQRSI